MSKSIGEVHGFKVMASSGGVELHGESVANPPEEAITITPDEAIEFAALLTRAAIEHLKMIDAPDAMKCKREITDTYRRTLAILESTL